MRQAAYDRTSQHTLQLLLGAGDADSLAAAAMLGIGSNVDPAQRLMWISRAVEVAPDRPDLLWLNIRLCSDVEGCDLATLEARLHQVDPDNGAAWFDRIGQAGKRNDAAALRTNLVAMAMSTRFDTYWNTTVTHVTNAVLKTHTMDLPTALVATIGMAAALAIPPYQTIANACNGESLKDPDAVVICRKVASAMRHGDTYITELIGVAIAERVWPEGSAEYLDAVSAKRVAHYRMDADGKISLRLFRVSRYAANRLKLMTDNKSEQEVDFAEIVRAKLNPSPPSDWTDK